MATTVKPAQIDTNILQGWISDPHTWTYASASTFTIAGVDMTSTFTKGTRLKFTQTTAKYAVVINSSFSTDTTVTIAVNTDYVIANAAITSPYYSYQVSPQGYPTSFTFATSWTGFSVNPAGVMRYSILGNICSIQKGDLNASSGTSNATTLTFTVPAAVNYDGIGVAFGKDNSGNLSTPCEIVFNGGSATVTAFKSFHGTAWTGGGTAKDLYIPMISYSF